MRAILLRAFGPPETLVPADVPEPVPGAGQALVGVAFVNVTFVETQFRATGAGPRAAEPPLIPGNGVGGVVLAVGAGVDAGLVGARVVTATGGSGAYAERVAVEADGMLLVPDGLALDDATALLSDGRTAVMLLAAVAPRPGERVLVEAAAGGVGTLLVQLAKAAGAVVVAGVGGARKRALALELGADVVVDYGAPGWGAHVLAGAGILQVVLDGVGGTVGREAFGLLAPGGRMASYGRASGSWADVADDEAAEREVTLLRGPFGDPAELRAFAEHALAEAAAGRLRPVIGQRVALEHAADAHAAIEARETVGKTLLVP